MLFYYIRREFCIKGYIREIVKSLHEVKRIVGKNILVNWEMIYVQKNIHVLVFLEQIVYRR